jgi:heat shock protein HslJ
MGGYTLSADGLKLEMSQMASTMMACPEPLMAQEGRYLGLLGAVTGYSVAGDVLTLTTADGKTVKARR